MKLYVTYTSPYARLARIVVLEKNLQDRVEVIVAKTRTADSPYYKVNPSGRVPYLVDDAGVGTEDSQVICAYLDALDGEPLFHPAKCDTDWAFRRFEANARSLCDGIAVWTREMGRPPGERSPTVLSHEAERARRMADVFEARASDGMMQGAVRMPHFIIIAALDVARARGLGDLTEGRPHLAAWHRELSERPSVKATALPVY